MGGGMIFRQAALLYVDNPKGMKNSVLQENDLTTRE
jgi:hypothetical protein